MKTFVALVFLVTASGVAAQTQPVASIDSVRCRCTGDRFFLTLRGGTLMNGVLDSCLSDSVRIRTSSGYEFARYVDVKAAVWQKRYLPVLSFVGLIAGVYMIADGQQKLDEGPDPNDWFGWDRDFAQIEMAMGAIGASLSAIWLIVPHHRSQFLTGNEFRQMTLRHSAVHSVSPGIRIKVASF